MPLSQCLLRDRRIRCGMSSRRRNTVIKAVVTSAFSHTSHRLPLLRATMNNQKPYTETCLGMLHTCTDILCPPLLAGPGAWNPPPREGGFDGRDGSITVNGVRLPMRVAQELRMLGMTLAWYSAGELEDAVEACSIDSQLIDDPGGGDFRDRLTLTPDELPQGTLPHPSGLAPSAGPAWGECF